MSDRPLLVLDSASLYYRSYFALPESMVAPDGHPHNAVRGFLDTIAALVTRHRPRGLICAWDSDWRPQWRVDLVPSYKTHRVAEDGEAEAEPDTLGPQIGAIADLLDAWGFARIGFDEYEADDVIASVADQFPGPIIVVTGDRDLFQLIDEARDVSVLYTARGGMDKWPLLRSTDVVEKYGVTPQQYVDFATLRGDPSDGLPGVRGVGEKTARSLIETLGSLDDVIAAADADPPTAMSRGVASKIQAAVEYLIAARDVVATVRSLPVVDVDPGLPDGVPHDVTELADEWGVGRSVDRLAHSLIDE